jgi:2-polyprenyl-3-methyl-5-hydroxy-6-metoxy-1,4-benzoquinol methylase
VIQVTGQVVDIGGLKAVQTARCKLGHTDEPSLLWTKNGFRYLQCPSCKLVWVDPQLTDESVAQIYATIFQNKLEPASPTNFSAYIGVLKQLAPYNTTGRLLDVGCFTGKFLLAAQADGWTHAEGTEISASAITYARETWGLTIHHGDLLTLDLKPNYYDAITLFDVIEHVSDPLSTLKRIAGLLRPGGVLYMNTPHVNSIPRMLLDKQWSVFFPWHRHYFSAAAMHQALAKSGFTVKRMDSLGIMPFSTYDAWKAYRKTTTVQEKTNRPFLSRVKENPLVRRHRDSLRTIWLGLLRSTEMPFRPLSRIGIHIGATLVVYAEPIET